MKAAIAAMARRNSRGAAATAVFLILSLQVLFTHGQTTVQNCVQVRFVPVLQNGMHEISWNISDPCLHNVGGGPYCFHEVPNPELPNFFHPLFPDVPGYQDPLLLCSFEDDPLLDPIFPQSTIVEACIFPGLYTINMFDSDGDGWTGAPLGQNEFPGTVIQGVTEFNVVDVFLNDIYYLSFGFNFNSGSSFSMPFFIPPEAAPVYSIHFMVSPLQVVSPPDPSVPFPLVEFFISYVSYNTTSLEAVQSISFTIVNDDGSVPIIVGKLTPLGVAADNGFEFTPLGDPSQNSITGFSIFGVPLPPSYEDVSQIVRVQLQQTGDLENLANPCLSDITLFDSFGVPVPTQNMLVDCGVEGVDNLDDALQLLDGRAVQTCDEAENAPAPAPAPVPAPFIDYSEPEELIVPCLGIIGQLPPEPKDCQCFAVCEEVETPSMCYAACQDDGSARIAGSLEELRSAMGDPTVGAITLTTDIVLDKELSGVWGVSSFGNTTNGEELPLWGLPQVNRALAIYGNCPSGPCIIDGNGTALIFLVNNGRLTLYDLILQNAKPTENYSGNFELRENGGALRLMQTSSVWATRIQFIENIANSGGAVSIESASNSEFICVDCVFFNNSAIDNGDICNEFFPETFRNCSATVDLVGTSFGAAIFADGSGSRVSLIGCQFIGNRACTLGAGVWMSSPGGELTLVNNTYFNNRNLGTNIDGPNGNLLVSSGGEFFGEPYPLSDSDVFLFMRIGTTRIFPWPADTEDGGVLPLDDDQKFRTIDPPFTLQRQISNFGCDIDIGPIVAWEPESAIPQIELLSLPRYSQSNEAFVDVLESREVGETVIELCQADISAEEQLILSLINVANSDASFVVQKRNTSPYEDESASATRFVFGDLNLLARNDSGNYTGNDNLGAFSIIYSVEDPLGMSASKTRIIEVEDATPPEPGCVNSGCSTVDEFDYWTEQETFRILWTGFTEDSGTVVLYEVGIGSQPGLDDIFPFTIYDLSDPAECENSFCEFDYNIFNETAVSLGNGATYFPVVRAYNEVGLERFLQNLVTNPVMEAMAILNQEENGTSTSTNSSTTIWSGVLIDSTPPVLANLVCGLSCLNEDIDVDSWNDTSSFVCCWSAANDDLSTCQNCVGSGVRTFEISLIDDGLNEEIFGPIEISAENTIDGSYLFLFDFESSPIVSTEDGMLENRGRYFGSIRAIDRAGNISPPGISSKILVDVSTPPPNTTIATATNITFEEQTPTEPISPISLTLVPPEDSPMFDPSENSYSFTVQAEMFSEGVRKRKLLQSDEGLSDEECSGPVRVQYNGGTISEAAIITVENGEITLDNLQVYGICPGDSYRLLISMTQLEFRGVVETVEVGPISNRECIASEFEGISSTGFPECTRYTCERGSFFDLEAAVAGECSPLNEMGEPHNGECCVLCPQGTASNDERALSCQPCIPGTFADLEGLQECIACATGTYQEDFGQASCEDCQAGASHTIRGSASHLDCVCIAGRYNASAYSDNPEHNPNHEDGVVSTDDTVCLECPDGASCNGGDEIPIPDSDYWGEMEFPTKFFSCVTGRCRGGWDDSTGLANCDNGYEDVQCANCENDYSLVNGVCERCNSWARVREAVGIPLIIILWALVNHICMDSPGLDLSLAFFQKVSILLAFGVRWPEALVEVFTITSLAAFNIDVITPGCSVDWSYKHSYFLQALLPAIVFTIYVSIYAVNWAILQVRRRAIEKRFATAIILRLFTFIRDDVKINELAKAEEDGGAPSFPQVPNGDSLPSSSNNAVGTLPEGDLDTGSSMNGGQDIEENSFENPVKKSLESKRSVKFAAEEQTISIERKRRSHKLWIEARERSLSCFYLARWRREVLRRRQNVSLDNTISVIASFFNLLLVASLLVAVIPFACDDFADGDDSFLKASPPIECGSRLHRAMIGVGVIMLAFVVSFLSFYFFELLRRKWSNRLTKERFSRRFSWMFERYHFSAVLWEVKISVEKLLLVVFAVLIPDVQWQLFAALVLALAGLSFHLIVQPFTKDFQLFNYVEATYLGVFTLFVVAGFVFENDDWEGNIEDFAEIYSFVFIILGVIVAISVSSLDIRRLFLQQRAATDVVLGIGCQRQLLSESERELEGELVEILTRPRHFAFCIPAGGRRGLISQKGKYLVYPQEEEFASFIKPGLVNRWARGVQADRTDHLAQVKGIFEVIRRTDYKISNLNGPLYYSGQIDSQLIGDLMRAVPSLADFLLVADQEYVEDFIRVILPFATYYREGGHNHLALKVVSDFHLGAFSTVILGMDTKMRKRVAYTLRVLWEAKHKREDSDFGAPSSFHKSKSSASSNSEQSFGERTPKYCNGDDSSDSIDVPSTPMSDTPKAAFMSLIKPSHPLEQTPQFRGVRISEAASSDRGLAECLKDLLSGPELRHDITRASFHFGVQRLDSESSRQSSMSANDHAMSNLGSTRHIKNELNTLVNRGRHGYKMMNMIEDLSDSI